MTVQVLVAVLKVVVRNMKSALTNSNSTDSNDERIGHDEEEVIPSQGYSSRPQLQDCEESQEEK